MKKNLLKLTSILSVFVLVWVIAFPKLTFATPPSGGCPAGTRYDSSADSCVPDSSPSSVAAVDACASVTGLGNIICKLQVLLNTIVPLLITLGIVYFIWGIIQFVIAGGEEAKTKGRDKIIYGLIGLAVIVGMWGLVNIVTRTFGISASTTPSLDSLTPSEVGTGSTSSCTIPNNVKLQDYLNYFTSCIVNNSIIPFIFAIAVVAFIWGVANFFIINADEESKRAQGKQFMLWGIVALAVMLSVWGLVNILGTTFGLKGGSALPQVRPPSN